MSGFEFSESRGHSVVRFEARLLDMSWGDVEKEAAEIVEKIKDTETARLVIDLTPMHLIQSGLVASLVRMWKATDGWHNRKVVVASDNEVVKEVIRSAGLLNLLKVVDTMDEAKDEIKVSTEAQVVHRENRVLAWAALPIALFSAAALYPVFGMDNEIIKTGARTTAMLAASVASIAAIFSMVRDEGFRRGFGVLSLVIGLSVLGILNADRLNPAAPTEEESTEDADSPSASAPAASPSASADNESVVAVKLARSGA